jgi:hypothetical protein
LNERCGEDSALRARVNALLVANVHHVRIARPFRAGFVQAQIRVDRIGKGAVARQRIGAARFRSRLSPGFGIAVIGVRATAGFDGSRTLRVARSPSVPRWSTVKCDAETARPTERRLKASSCRSWKSASAARCRAWITLARPFALGAIGSYQPHSYSWGAKQKPKQ